MILVRIFFKILDLFEIFRKIQFWSNFRKISILLKNFEKFRFIKSKKNYVFVQISEKISIFAKIVENLDFGQIFEKFRCCSKFSKISKNFDFGHIFEKLKFGQVFEKKFILVRIFFKIFDLFEIFQKILVKLSKNFDFVEKFPLISIYRKFRKISILVKISKNYVYGQISEKISIFFKIVENYDCS